MAFLLLEENEKFVFLPPFQEVSVFGVRHPGSQRVCRGLWFWVKAEGRRQSEGEPPPRPFEKDKIAGVTLLQGLEGAKQKVEWAFLAGVGNAEKAEVSGRGAAWVSDQGLCPPFPRQDSRRYKTAGLAVDMRVVVGRGEQERVKNRSQVCFASDSYRCSCPLQASRSITHQFRTGLIT